MQDTADISVDYTARNSITRGLHTANRFLKADDKRVIASTLERITNRFRQPHAILSSIDGLLRKASEAANADPQERPSSRTPALKELNAARETIKGLLHERTDA